MTFDTSAVRTLLGVAICLFAVPFAEKRGVKSTLFFFVITILAAQIHRSAYIFIAVYFVIKIKFSLRSAIFYVGIPMMLLLLRTQFYGLINMYLKSVQESSVSIGGNLIIYIVCLALTGAIWYHFDRGNKNNYEENGEQISNGVKGSGKNDDILDDYFSTSGLAMRMIYMAIVLQLFSSGTVLARMAEYLQLFILILVPNNVARISFESRIVFKSLLYLFAILYFWYFSLVANALEIVPYQFFWNI